MPGFSSIERFIAKKAFGQKNLHFCAPSAGSGRGGNTPGPECGWFPPHSALTRTWPLPYQAPVGTCGKDLRLSSVCSCICLMGCEPGVNVKGWRWCSIELCHSEATVSHLERVADARFKVFPVVSSLAHIYSHFQV